MGPHRVVVPPPTLNEHLGLQERVELLSGQELVAEPAVEALAVAVLPRTAWGDFSARRDRGSRRTRSMGSARCIEFVT